MKKEFRKLFLVLLVFVSVFTSVSLGSVTQTQAATKLYEESHPDNKISLKKGQKYTLHMNYKGKRLASSKFKFKSSNPKVMSVSSKGVLKANKKGSAKIYVTLKSNTKVKSTIISEVVSSSKKLENSSSKEEPAKPSGKQVVQGGTADTSFGVKIPVVSEFNTLALDSRNYWTGETSASNDFSKAFGEALQKYSDAAKYGIHDSPIQDAGDYVFHTGVAGDDMGPITLKRNTEKGCYYFYYTVDLNDYDKEGIAINRDLSRFLLALVTSTPTEVEKAIYESQFTAPSGKEPIKGEWTKVGDCEIKYTRGQPDPYIYEYAIRPAK